MLRDPDVVKVIIALVAEYRRASSLASSGHRFEWAVAIDTSGSMSIYRRELRLDLVAVMEVLRKLERPFSICVMPNHVVDLLHAKGNHFDIVSDQAVLEKIVCGGRTTLSSCLKKTIEMLWDDPSSPPGETLHRMLLIFTGCQTVESEGLVGEAVETNWLVNVGCLAIVPQSASEGRSYTTSRQGEPCSKGCRPLRPRALRWTTCQRNY